MSVWHQHAYLWGSLLGVLFVLWVCRVSPRHGKAIFLCALVSAPAGWISCLVERAYWSPVRLGGGNLGLEDFLCSFTIGGLLWWLMVLIPQVRAQDFSFGKFFPRYFAVIVPLNLVFFGLLKSPLHPMSTAILSLVVLGVAMVVVAPGLMWMGGIGLVLFTIDWWVNLQICFYGWPEFAGAWNAETWHGWSVLGVPLGELVWAAVFGASWPVFMAWCLDAKTVRCAGHRRSASGSRGAREGTPPTAQPAGSR